ncbi:hypothetical protein LTR16_000147 [Cryomyces antarcticus]|uniref:Transcription factor domain-containing protein n=1 Tax=Cryomyces antarcticus TaxID=329879 RepID=A0ABR0LT50_9PEZI|nr:hypothetical protein LTR16_000147 [Cryomyces antarcticus]
MQLCAYPPRTRVSRGRRGARHAELARKLGHLEEMIARLGSKENGRELGEVAGTVPACDSGIAEETQGTRLESVTRDIVSNGGREPRTSEETGPAKADKFMGGPFWRSLSSEVGGLLQLLDQTTEEDTDLDDVLEPSASKFHVPNPRFPFESGPQAVALRSLHPSTSHVALLLKIYQSNVDPIFKLLHRPTLRLSVLEAAADLHNMPGGQSMEALMFAIYFAAVTTLTEENCVAQFAEQKNALSVRFRYGTEMALANADFLSSDNMSTLQALVLFVVSYILTYLHLKFAIAKSRRLQLPPGDRC